jgi:hypothetical protein
MFIAILTIIIGAVLTAGGVQELVVQGVFSPARHETNREEYSYGRQ